MTIPWLRTRKALLVVVAIALAGCQSTTDDTTPSPAPTSAAPSASPEPSSAGSVSPTDVAEGVETSVFALEAGDCFSAESDSVESVLVVDCQQPHTYEAYFLFDHEAGPDEAFPGDDEILDYADSECQPPFEEFVGKDYESSIWYITSVTPSAETWAAGDREIICTLDQQDANGEAIEVTGSAEGAAE
jgi:putative regulator of septum formation